MCDKIHVFYELTCGPGQRPEKLSRAIALEQTVETPESAIDEPWIRERIVGTTESIDPLPDRPGRFRVCIAYHADVTGYEIPQLLNLLFGNISMKDNIKIVDIRFPNRFLQRFTGPRYGVDGLRQLTGVYDRPLAATALKPMGRSPEDLAAMAQAFASAGLDIVKDDHGLANQPFCPFEERVERVQRAVDEANGKTGVRTVYFPAVTGPFDEIAGQLDWAVRQGITGVLISPFLVGPDTLRYAAAHYPLVIMAHPALTGAHFHTRRHGITPGVLLGTINRLLGADIAVFPNSGGRFGFSGEGCRDIAEKLRRPMGQCRPAWPAPAGGMRVESIGSMAKQYGVDTVYLIGGALLDKQKGYECAAREMMQAVGEHFEERRTPAAVPTPGIPARPDAGRGPSLLRYTEDGTWTDRSPITYKNDRTLPFAGVSRTELVGKHGEQTAFDVRYFKIQPGGYTSRERHRHEHVIIGVHGRGAVKLDDETLCIGTNDIAYVKPMQAHQVVNEGDQDFGFYCIVDHRRDKPREA